MSDIEKLIRGFQRFRARYFERDRELFQQLAREGQTPRTLVIACSDSRVDPAIITDAEPGDLFVIRNVANLVPPAEDSGAFHGTSAAVQFAVCDLEVRHIVVMGHGHCGGIRALLEGDAETGYIGNWVRIAGRARDKVLERWPDASPAFRQRAAERMSIIVSLENLMTFDFVRTRVEAGTLKLYGWYFDIENGELMQYDTEARRFHDLYLGWP